MNDILKVEMLMIEVTTLKCKIEIFQYSMYMWWHEGDLLFGHFIVIVNGIIQAVMILRLYQTLEYACFI